MSSPNAAWKSKVKYKLNSLYGKVDIDFILSIPGKGNTLVVIWHDKGHSCKAVLLSPELKVLVK